MRAPLPYPVGVGLLLAVGAVVVGTICVNEGRNKRCQDRKKNRYALSEALQADRDSPLRELLEPSPRLDRLLAELNGETEIMEFLQPRAFLRDAVCLSTRAERLPGRIEPLAVTFEPLLLTVAPTTLRPSTTPCLEAHGGRFAPDQPTCFRRIRRILSAPQRGWMLLLSSFLVLEPVTIVSTHHLTLGDLIIHIPVLIACMVFLIRSIFATERMFVIPGGLIDTRQKHVYRRSMGLMVWCPDSNTLHVRSLDADRDLALVVSPSEAVAAIRAWLSPADEPSDEALKPLLDGTRG